MKKITLIVTLVLCVLLVGCTVQPPPPVQPVDEHFVLTAYDPEPSRFFKSEIFGGVDSYITEATLDSNNNVTITKGLGHLGISLNAGSDYNGSLVVKGTMVDEATGNITYNYTEIVNVTKLTNDNSYTDANSNLVHNITDAYLTTHKFYGDIVVYTEDLNMTDIDLYHFSFESFKQQNLVKIDTFDITLQTTDINAEFDAYLYHVDDGLQKLNIYPISSLHIGNGGLPALENKYWELEARNLGDVINTSDSGIFVEAFYSNNPAYVEDVMIKVWGRKGRYYE